MSDGVRVWCLRHGEAESNLARALGAQPTAPLTARGREQAEAAARLLSTEPVTRFYASTAVRAVQTAGIIAGSRRVVTTPLLAEVGIGVHTDPTDPAARTASAAALRAWVVDQDLDPAFPGGETGHDVTDRMTRALSTIAAARPGETVVVVGHVASLTAGLSVLCGLRAEVWGRPLAHARPFLVTYDGGRWGCDWPAAPTTAVVR